MTRIKNNESGMVSILITMVLITVISITVLSFAQIIRREQRQALDAQLSSQAFYAAESGINNILKIINDKGGSPDNKTTCDPTSYMSEIINPVLTGNAADEVKFTCTLVTTSPTTLNYTLNPSDASKVFPLHTSSAIGSLDINWKTSEGAVDPADCPDAGAANNLPPAEEDKWTCPYGAVRIDIVPEPSAGNSYTRATLMSNARTAFLLPTRGNSNPGSIGSGTIKAIVNCTDDDGCTARISGLGGNRYYARISALYKPLELELSTSSNQRFNDAQVVVDSTGRAQDVLRRIQVRVPLVSNGVHGEYALQTEDSICKYYTTFPGYSNAADPACENVTP